MLVANVCEIEKLAIINSEIERKIIENFMPGPLTIVLQKKNIVSDKLTAKKDTVGVRIPTNKIAQEILNACKEPLATSSANLSGKANKTNIKEIIKIAKTRDAIIIEDCAHALYTDYIDGNCGNHSDVSIYSLHKMLPYKDGGMVRINNESTIKLENNNYYYNLLEYDLREISKKRKENATLIEKELENVKGIRFIRKMNLYKNQTPQTYPIIILKKDKNEIYHKLNEKGYGVVSLYHTMIKNLQNEKYNISNEIASKILNLPVHQDVEKEQIYQMCEYLKQLIKG